MAGNTNDVRRQMNRFFTASGLNVVDVFLAVVFALVLSPYILKATGDRYYGIFVLISSFAGWFSLLDFGIGQSVSRFMTLYYTRRDEQKCNAAASGAFWLFLLIGVVCFLISCAIVIAVRSIQPDMRDLDVFSKVMFFFGLAFVVNFPTNVCEGVLCGVLRHDVNATRLIIFRLLCVTGSFLAIYLGGKVVALAVVNLVVNSVNFVIVYLLARRFCPAFRPSLRAVSRPMLGEMFHYGIAVFMKQLGETILSRSGILIISLMIAIDEAAPYSLVIVSLAGYGPVVFNAVTDWQTNWFTHLAEKGDAGAFERARRTVCKTSIYLAAFIGFGYVFWGRPFIERWIGPQYLGIYPALAALAIFYWLTCGENKTNWRLLLATARHLPYSRLVLLHALLAVALGVLLVYRGYGALGVVLGNVLPGFVIYYVIAAVYTCRVAKLDIGRYYRDNICAQLVAALCLVPAAVVTKYFAAPSYVSLFTVGIVSLCTYVPLVVLFGLTKEERRSLRNRRVTDDTADDATGEMDTTGERA